MRYLGGKQRLGKRIAEIINLCGDLTRAESYCEPFCGVIGVGRHITFPIKTYRDASLDLITFLTALRGGWDPPSVVTVEDYARLKMEQPSATRGFVGFGCSFGGKWFGGYARGNRGSQTYASQARESAKRLQHFLTDAVIQHGDYTNSPPSDVTYCDPPYSGTTRYLNTPTVDTIQFWEWCKQRKGLVFVSEYNGPDWANCVWSRPVKCMINAKATAGDIRNHRIEKLFFIDNE